MPVFVKASSRAKAYYRGVGGSKGKFRRTALSRQDPRGTNYPKKLENHHKAIIKGSRISRAKRKKSVKFLRTFRHGH